MGRGGSRTAAMNNPETDDSRGEEEDSSQEGKSDISFELGALGFASDAVPVPNTSAVHRAHVVDEESESGDVENKDDEVGGPVEEAGSEWEEEDQRKENADSCYDLCVDEALLRPCRSGFVLVKPLSCKTCDGS